MAAEDIAINSFSITGDLGADGGGAADGAVLHTNVASHEFTLFVKRVYNAGDLADADVLNVANEFLGKNIVGPAPWTLTVGPGEVWIQADFGNYQIADYGDAPDPAYPTLAANGGARPLIVTGGPYLGSAVAADLDGQPHALGDDAGGVDDEDGVVFSTRLVVGEAATLTVTTWAGGLLNAWIDWNRDGDGADAGEQVFTDRALAAGAKSNGSNALSSAIWGQWDPASQWKDTKVGDFNRDGYDDVVGRDKSNHGWVGKSNGWDKFAKEHWGKWNAADWFDVLGGDFAT